MALVNKITVFGLNASSVAFGFFLGPIIAGTVAAVTSAVPPALFVVAALALLLSAMLGTWAREPTR